MRKGNKITTKKKIKGNVRKESNQLTTNKRKLTNSKLIKGIMRKETN